MTPTSYKYLAAVVAVVLFLWWRTRRSASAQGAFEGMRVAFALQPECGFCRSSHPAWVEATKQRPSLRADVLVAGEDDDALARLAIEAYPTFVLWRGEQEVARKVGAVTSQELGRFLDEAAAAAG